MLGAFVVGALLVSGSLLFVAPYVDVERAGLESRTVLARVDSRGRDGLAIAGSRTESLGGGRRSGERERRLAMLRRPPWYSLERTAGAGRRGGEEGSASETEAGLVARGGAEGTVR